MGVRTQARLPSAFALGVLVFGVRTARAATADDIPSECGSRAAFEEELKKRLGEDAPVESVHVSITPRGERFHLRVQIDDELRELDDASCSELFRASVVIAVSVLLHTDEPANEKAKQPPPPPPKPREYPRLALGAGVGGSFGTLPKLVLAAELEGKALWSRFGVSAHLRYLAPVDRLDAQGKGAELWALGAGLSGIFRPSPLWETRVGFAAQRITGHGQGSARDQDAVVWAAGPTLGLGLVALQKPSFWLGADVEGQLNAVRGRLQILNYSEDINRPPHEVWRVKWLSAAAFVRFGLVW
jgi:hypothetical protein